MLPIKTVLFWDTYFTCLYFMVSPVYKSIKTKSCKISFLVPPIQTMKEGRVFLSAVLGRKGRNWVRSVWAAACACRKALEKHESLICARKLGQSATTDSTARYVNKLKLVFQLLCIEMERRWKDIMKLRMIEIKETKSATTDSNVRIISEKTS